LEVKRILKLEVQIPAEAFFNVVGTKDENLRFFEEIFGLKIFAR
jgi:phosphate starvation-inducible PhoH-like protein